MAYQLSTIILYYINTIKLIFLKHFNLLGLMKKFKLVQHRAYRFIINSYSFYRSLIILTLLLNFPTFKEQCINLKLVLMMHNNLKVRPASLKQQATNGHMTNNFYCHIQKLIPMPCAPENEYYSM